MEKEPRWGFSKLTKALSYTILIHINILSASKPCRLKYLLQGPFLWTGSTHSLRARRSPGSWACFETQVLYSPPQSTSTPIFPAGFPWDVVDSFFHHLPFLTSDLNHHWVPAEGFSHQKSWPQSLFKPIRCTYLPFGARRRSWLKCIRRCRRR